MLFLSVCCMCWFCCLPAVFVKQFAVVGVRSMILLPTDGILFLRTLNPPCHQVVTDALWRLLNAQKQSTLLLQRPVSGWNYVAHIETIMSSTSLFHEGRELCSVQRYYRLPQPKSKSTAKLMPLTGLKKALCKYPDIPHSYIIGPLIHSCMYTHMHPSIHTYIKSFVHNASKPAYIPASNHAHLYTYMYKQAYTQPYLHPYIDLHTCLQTHMHVFVYIYVCIYICIQSCIHTLIYTHIHG